jgi:type II secretory pathway pseudopilin PulG
MQLDYDMKRSATGFTLVEIALVLVIIGFVTTGLLRMFDGPRSSAKYVEDQQKLADIKASIMAYVARHRALPCPNTDIDNDNDGVESVTDQHCDANEGYLPYQTLKTHARNAYGERFYYVTTVDASASQDAVRNSDSSASYYGHTPETSADLDDLDDTAPYFRLKTPPTAQDDGEGLIFVCEKGVADGSCDGSSQFEASSMITAVVSFGANSDKTWKGTGSSYPSGGVPDCPAGLTGAEQLNCDNATHSINGVDHQLLHNAQQTKDGFDDAMIWVSAYEVKKLLGLGKRAEAPNIVSENNFQTSESIEEFLNATSTGGLDRTGGQSGWEEASDPRTITVNSDGDTQEVTVLTQTQDEERALFVEIPEGTDEYILNSIVELGDGDEGGYGVFFDTLLENDSVANAVVDRGYIVQFNRGYSGAAENESSMLLRDWQEGENYESDDGPYDGAYYRVPARVMSQMMVVSPIRTVMLSGGKTFTK